MSDKPNLWQQRLSSATRFYQEWESKFRCSTLEDYYSGFHWRNKQQYSTGQYNPYTINLVYNTIKIKQSTLLFQCPSFLVSPRPGNSQWDLDFAVQSAQLKQDTLNTIIKNPSTYFVDNLKLILLDSFFRFGVAEVGYANNFMSPQADIPLTREWETGESEDENGARRKRDLLPTEQEKFYVKRIPPKRFRTSLSEATELRDCEWVAYFEYFYTNVLKASKDIHWPANAASAAPYNSSELTSGILGSPIENRPEFSHLLAASKMSKCWHVWDQIAKKRYLLLDGAEEEPLYEEPCDRLPIFDLRWDLRLEGFYPIPPVFQWLSPQDEINEAREQTRSYRRRFTRKFQCVAGAADEEEVEKFVSGPDGIVVYTKTPDAIKAIDNPEQGPTTENALLLAKDDFNIISGTSAESRGQIADRETATQAKIVSARSQQRESFEQLQFSNYVSAVGREVLLQAQEKLAEGLWIQYTQNPSQQILQDLEINKPLFKYIKSQDLSDGYDFVVDVNVEEATPAALETAKQSFMNFVAMMQNYPMLAKSPVLVRETAYRLGYRNELVIHQMQQAALVQQMAEMIGQQAGQQTGAPQGQNSQNVAQTQIAQQTPNTVAQTDRQIQKQLLQ